MIRNAIWMLTIALLASSAGAGLIDSFDGTPGDPLADWSTQSAFSYGSEGLSTSSVPGTGNSAYLDAVLPSGQSTSWTSDYTGPEPMPTGDAVYFSALLKVADPTDMTDAAQVGVHLEANRNFGVVIERSPESGADFVVKGKGSSREIPYTPGDTVLVIGKLWDLPASGWREPKFDIAFDPDLSAEPTWTDTNTAGGNTNQDIFIDAVSLFAFADKAGDWDGWNQEKWSRGYVDEIRLGTSYADVAVPEPASMALLATGAIGLLARRRRA